MIDTDSKSRTNTRVYRPADLTADAIAELDSEAAALVTRALKTTNGRRPQPHPRPPYLGRHRTVGEQSGEVWASNPPWFPQEKTTEITPPEPVVKPELMVAVPLPPRHAAPPPAADVEPSDAGPSVSVLRRVLNRLRGL